MYFNAFIVAIETRCLVTWRILLSTLPAASLSWFRIAGTTFLGKILIDLHVFELFRFSEKVISLTRPLAGTLAHFLIDTWATFLRRISSLDTLSAKQLDHFLNLGRSPAPRPLQPAAATHSPCPLFIHQKALTTVRRNRAILVLFLVFYCLSSP